MAKTVELKDGTAVVIREIGAEDLEESLAFFRALPEDDRRYLRRDVTQREIVERRLADVASGRVRRLVAQVDNHIVADGALELESEDWAPPTAEIRLIVARQYQGLGLGTLMARELYLLANQEKVEEIVVKTMGPQVAPRRIFERLGFHHDSEVTDGITDISGARQDLIVMRCRLEELWQHVSDYLEHSDWKRTR
ncbi:MAG TPA: GNAT family N-acetyltransferase [candidate division Zixibacteria bacterium]|nr:GNAT family N-acetyltransferase [candidate division Zixibacteria bacterium]